MWGYMDVYEGVPALSPPTSQRGRHLPEHVLQQARAARNAQLGRQGSVSNSDVKQGARRHPSQVQQQPTRSVEHSAARATKPHARSHPEPAARKPPQPEVTDAVDDQEVLRQAWARPDRFSPERLIKIRQDWLALVPLIIPFKHLLYRHSMPRDT